MPSQPDSISRRRFLERSALAGAAAWGAPTFAASGKAGAAASREWQHYGGDIGASRYSPLEQIQRRNVARLKVKWVHRTGDAMERPQTTIECTPIVVDGVMYVTTARVQTRALDAATGKVLWNFDPDVGRTRRGAPGVSRGVCYWQDAEGADQRIFSGVKELLFCLDARTGELVKGFGEDGMLDLRKNLDTGAMDWSFTLSSPPVAYQDLILVGGGGGEGPYPAAPGHIRAFDARTGERRWIFHTIPQPGEFGHDTWEGDSWKRSGGANNWAGMSLDAQRGILYASTGSPSFDFYGGDRKGANLFGNSVLALDAATGKRLWHFQTVHHDLWDYDLPAQPALVTVKREGRTIDAVAQVTKTGMLFLFDRVTGEPVYPIEERPVPPSDLPGEAAWPTQPFPTKPRPFTRHRFSEDDITDISPQSTAYIREIYRQSRAGTIFIPPSFEGTVVFPGFLGGALWGGCSFDPATGILYVNSSANSNLLNMVKARPDQPFPYNHKGYVKFLDHEGYPAVKPPWGLLSAIDLGTGEYVWESVLGEVAELTARGVPRTGTLNVGGSIATAGGLVFVAATMDEKFRAFDSATGETLWEHTLEAGGYATPCTYEADGEQHVIIAAGGGGKPRTKTGDAFVAFSLG